MDHIANLKKTIDFLETIKNTEAERIAPFTLFANVARYIQHDSNMDDKFKLEQLLLNARIIGMNPSVWVSENHMETPTCVIRHDGVQHAVVARSHMLKAAFTVESMADGVYNNDDVVNAVSSEIFDLIRKVKDQGIRFIPYIPVILVRVVDSTTFEPYMKFKSRFALFDPHQEVTTERFDQIIGTAPTAPVVNPVLPPVG